MKYIETYYLGCESPYAANIGSSHLVRFCDSTMHYHTTILALLSEPMIKAQLIADENMSDKPYKISVIIPTEARNKYKNEDQESSFDRIVWYIKNLAHPRNGAIISVYESFEMNRNIETPWAMNQFWFSKEQWIQSDSNYITLNVSEKNTTSWKDNKLKESIEAVKHAAREVDLKVVEVDYTMRFEDLYRLLLGARKHFTYIGGSYSFAAFVGVPTVSFGKEYPIIENLSTTPIGGRSQGMMLKGTTWGRAQMSGSRITQYDHGHEMVKSGPPDYVSHVKGGDWVEMLMEIKNDNL